MSQQTYDVAIIGGGPAGAATALSLKQTKPELRILLIDPDDKKSPRIGETLPPAAEPLLRRLGVFERIQRACHLPVYSSSAAWGSAQPVTNEYFGQRYGRGWHLQRAVFDASLVEAAKVQGAHFCVGKFRHSHYSAMKIWELAIQQSAREPLQTMFAKFVVDASGRQGVFAKQQSLVPQKQDQLVGAACFFDRTPWGLDERNRDANPCNITDKGTTLVEAGESGWCYSAFLPQDQMVFVAMTDADIARRMRLHLFPQWLRFLKAYPYSAQRLMKQGLPSQVSPLVRAAHSQHLPRCTGHAWLAVGDAASCVDPLSSQGIARALHFALLASFAICDSFAGKAPGLAHYEALVQREFTQYLAQKCEIYTREQRWPQAPFWARRQEQNNALVQAAYA